MKLSDKMKTVRKVKNSELDEIVKKFNHIDMKFDQMKRDVGLFEKSAHEKVIRESSFEF